MLNREHQTQDKLNEIPNKHFDEKPSKDQSQPFCTCGCCHCGCVNNQAIIKQDSDLP
ncbi:MAG: hypothetical protein ACW99Q_17260 [Candidatus Kariarchaeaceae archaeon]